MIHYIFQAETSSSNHRKSRVLEKERKQGMKGSYFQSDEEEEETMRTEIARKRSMLPGGSSTLK